MSNVFENPNIELSDNVEVPVYNPSSPFSGSIYAPIFYNDGGTWKIRKIDTSFFGLSSQDEGLKILPISLDVAEVRALNSSPQAIIPAPGSGKAVIVEKVSLGLDIDGTAFVASGGSSYDVKIRPSGQTQFHESSIILSAFMQKDPGVHYSSFIGGMVLFDDTAIELYADNDFTGGGDDAVLSGIVYYRVVSYAGG